MSAQLPDKIIFNGASLDLYSNPLEEYFRSKKRKPAFNTSSQCVRGYVAQWEISHNRLLLKEIQGNYLYRNIFFQKKYKKISIADLFQKAKNKMVKATWFSGKLRIPQGKMTAFDDHGYASRFEKEIIISVEKGDVVKTVMLDNQNRMLINDENKIRSL